MKSTRITILALSAAYIAFQAAARATTIATWDFENAATTNTGASPSPAVAATIPAGINASGLASALHASSATVWSNPAGNGSAKALSSNTWATGDYYQFTLSISDNELAGMGLEVSLDQTGSNTGPRDFQLSYSVDGTNFTNFGAVYNVTNDTWSATSPKSISTRSFDLSSISAIDTALDGASSTITFRVSMADANAISGSLGTAGTDRVDNFIVTSVPEPSAALSLLLSAGVIIWRRRR